MHHSTVVSSQRALYVPKRLKQANLDLYRNCCYDLSVSANARFTFYTQGLERAARGPEAHARGAAAPNSAPLTPSVSLQPGVSFQPETGLLWSDTSLGTTAKRRSAATWLGLGGRAAKVAQTVPWGGISRWSGTSSAAARGRTTVRRRAAAHGYTLRLSTTTARRVKTTEGMKTPMIGGRPMM